MPKITLIFWNDDPSSLSEERYLCPQGARIDRQGVHDCHSGQLVARPHSRGWQSSASEQIFSDISMVSDRQAD